MWVGGSLDDDYDTNCIIIIMVVIIATINGMPKMS